MTETKVLKCKPPPGQTWYLGSNNGTLTGDGNRMSGSGKDKAGNTYNWSFSRK
jgi:hypothetical protein